MASCPAADTLVSDVCDSRPAPWSTQIPVFKSTPLLLRPRSNSLINDPDWISLNESLETTSTQVPSEE